MNSGSRYVSTAMVSQALGVSVTTVKRWVDEGILPAHKTVGGHRKVVVSDVLRLIREKNLPHVNLSKLIPQSKHMSFKDPHSIAAHLLTALQSANQELTTSIILDSFQHGFPMDDLADGIISPTLQEMERRAGAGTISLVQKRRAIQMLIASLYQLRSIIRSEQKENSPIAVGGAPEPDPSVLPTLMAKLTLLDNGWDAINLGPYTPIQAFINSLNELKPALLWLSVSVIQNADKFLHEYGQLYAKAKELSIPVAVSGVGLTPSIRERMPYTTFGDGMSHLAAFAETIFPRLNEVHTPSPKMLDPRFQNPFN